MRRDWLGTRRLSWRDLLVLVKQAPRGSALSRAVHGESDLWDLHGHLLGVIADLLASANWQRAGDNNAKRPTPIPRPGAKPIVDGETMARGKPVTTERMDALLGWTKE